MSGIFGDQFIAVGVTEYQEGKRSGVVLYVQSLGCLMMSEASTRKLADDLLRNANFLWPVEDEDEDETKGEKQ